ncbi:MAG: RsmD family RNA methyltransferase, partial [Candidatus Krumholzibacteriota bacterium]|nr:RsmD family RNA methyltransferase [Candidatus Krumholzibacteriota bacterium]
LAPAPVFVYADPPYGTEDVKKVLAHYDANTYSPLESVIVEHGVRTALGQPRSLVLLKEKRFGDTIVSYFGPRSGG